MKLIFKKALIAVLFFSITSPLFAQAPPDTEIHIYDLKEKRGKVTLSKGKNVTNRKGYDSQPSFYNDDMLLYSSSIDGQTDIMMYDAYEDKTVNMTETKDVSEYSPTLVPGFDSYSVIHQDAEGVQLLYLYHIDKKKKSQPIFEDIAPVGYHAWSGTDVAMFVLGQPNSMVLTNAKERKDRIITSNIGRTLKSVPNSNKIAFERGEEDKTNVIYNLDPDTDLFHKVITKPVDSSDWVITMQGTYITSLGSKLLKYNPKHDQNWTEFMDLSGLGTGVITRMAVNPSNNKIAVVVNH